MSEVSQWKVEGDWVSQGFWMRSPSLGQSDASSGKRNLWVTVTQIRITLTQSWVSQTQSCVSLTLTWVTLTISLGLVRVNLNAWPYLGVLKGLKCQGHSWSTWIGKFLTLSKSTQADLAFSLETQNRPTYGKGGAAGKSCKGYTSKQKTENFDANVRE